MRSLLCTLFYPLFLTVLFCSSDIAPSANAQTIAVNPLPAANTGKISGRVVSTLGAPVSKATVRLIQRSSGLRERGTPITIPPTFVGISGPDGSFSFENLAAADYGLQAQRFGFSNAGIDPATQDSLTPRVKLAEGEAKSDVEIKLSPLATVSGRVVDADGDPVMGAQIRLLRFTYPAGQTELVQIANGSGLSDDRGMFRLISVESGRYFLTADDQLSRQNQRFQEIRLPSALEMNFATYYPSSLDTRTAVKLDLKPGTELNGLDIRMIRGRAFTVRGVAVDASGSALQAQLTLVGGSGSVFSANRFSASSNASIGAFSFDAVPAGEYMLIARTAADPQPGKPTMFGRQEVSVRDGDIDRLKVQLAVGVTVTGRVIVPDGISDTVLVTVVDGVGTEKPNPTTVTINAVAGQSSNLVARLQPDGSFAIANVGPARYTLHVDGFSGAGYLESVVIDGRDVTTQYLDVGAAAPLPLQITMGNHLASVSGTVQNSKGAPVVADVVVWLKSPHLIESGIRFPNRFRSDGNGKFSTRGIPPGEYYIAAFEDANQFLQYPDFLARFNGSLKTIKLDEGAKETVELKWIPREATDREAANYPQ